MSESKWITTGDILNNEKIPFFQLAEWLAAGMLIPYHPEMGQPLLPPDLVELETLRDNFESGYVYAWDPGEDAETQDLRKRQDWDRLQYLEKQLKGRDMDMPWRGYAFQGGEIDYLRDAIFSRSEFESVTGGDNLLTAFSHSSDYRSVTKNGEKFSLTTSQSAVIQALHEAYKTGNPEISIDHVLRDRAGSASNKPRMQDTFKNNLNAYKTLVANGKRKGLIRLNI